MIINLERNMKDMMNEHHRNPISKLQTTENYGPNRAVSSTRENEKAIE